MEESEDIRESYVQKKCQDHNIKRYAKVDLLSDENDCLALEESAHDDDDDDLTTNNNNNTKKSMAHASAKVMPVQPGSFTIDDSSSEDEDDLL